MMLAPALTRTRCPNPPDMSKSTPIPTQPAGLLPSQAGFSYLCTVLAILLTSIAATATAATLKVGPGKPFDRIESAVAAASPGDTIQVYPLAGGQAYQAVGILVNKPHLTIRAAGIRTGQRITLSGKGYDHSGRGRTPRAIVEFNHQGDYGLLEGFELTGASNGSGNGAGVRINQANQVTIRHCDIHHNQMGIMSNGDGTPHSGVNQRIEHSRIHHNFSLTAGRFHHNLYLDGTSATLSFSEVHHAKTGHNIKSRAHFTRIEYSYVHHSANREFDLVDSRSTGRPDSHGVLIGNIIVKDPETIENQGVIHFGQEGSKMGHDGTLYLIHNTIVTPFTAPVVDLSSPEADAILVGNIIDDGGKPQNDQTLGDALRGWASAKQVYGKYNWLAPGFQNKLPQTSLTLDHNSIAVESRPLFVNPEEHDFHLRRAWPGIAGAGQPMARMQIPPTPGSWPEPPPLSQQYIHPQGSSPRTDARRPDLGALAY
ncbi:MAG: hypothetical protein GY703_16945 [Gammaproteobacteria bacterium]|nr:hypothetical protein [Gammaproteobacteria bacterium]